MKIKILKDIPGYKAREIIEVDIANNIKSVHGYTYYFDNLIKDGFAEEIKDDIDIEAIRQEYNVFIQAPMLPIRRVLDNMSEKEMEFVTSYRIVKEVITQLNGEYKSQIGFDFSDGYCIACKGHQNNDVELNYFFEAQFKNQAWNMNILPKCKDVKTAEKVIELCKEELSVLFGVK